MNGQQEKCHDKQDNAQPVKPYVPVGPDDKSIVKYYGIQESGFRSVFFDAEFI